MSDMFAALRAMAVPEGYMEPEDSVEVKSGDDVHYFVTLTINGKTSWLTPDYAREFGEALQAAADDADSFMTDLTRAEMYGD